MVQVKVAFIIVEYVGMVGHGRTVMNAIDEYIVDVVEL